MKIDIIGKSFISKDGYTAVVIKDLTPDKILSLSKYLLRFESGLEKPYTYVRLRDGFYKDKGFTLIKNRIGDVFISKDGYKCTVIAEVDADNKNSKKKRYTVQFEDGLTRDYNIRVLQQGFKRYYEDIQYADYTGNRYKSVDGYYATVIKQVSGSVPSEGSYLVKFDDGFEKVFTLHALTHYGFRRYRYAKDFVGSSFNFNTYSFKVIDCRLRDDKRYSMLLLEYDNGYREEVAFKRFHQLIQSPDTCSFIREAKYHNKIFTSIDGYRFKFIESVKSNHKIMYEDGHFDIVNDVNNVYRFGNMRSRCYIEGSDMNDYYLCTCRLCNLKFLVTQDEYFEHKLMHYQKI